ncbi:MAG: hypothetical protein U9N34_03095, partial [Candidatus Cloacimonadota bacterium]|nr:hypothetical protein [Candidatus Cloacimonadota bacterium]
YGFPYTLTKMIDKKILFMPNKIVRIHLTNVHVLAEGFVKALTNNIKTGSIFNIADKEPVELSKLADFINQELQKGEYSKFKIINKKFFEVGESISKFFKNELWVSRFQLISKSWYYDTKESYEVLKIHYRETIPEFKIVTNWYKQITKKD